MCPPITLRPVTSDDEPFLYRVYASTREEELAPLGWDETQKEAFLRTQFNAQHVFYQEQFTSADFNIILAEDKPIGRLYVDRRDDEIRIVEIALLPEHRNSGIGSALLKILLTEAAAASKPVRIHVERFNPALRLYERLGFIQVGDNGVYYLMEWSPDESQQPS
jgi:ribosomal protein S18 acetylase RimI-like enzyme